MAERERSRLRRVATIGGVTALIAVGLAGTFYGLTPGLSGGGEAATEFRPQTVARGLLRETVIASGRMEPLVRVPVIAEVSGVIAAVHVEEGQRVRQGQPLFELDRERLSARVAERRAELALREANARYDVVGRAEAERDQARRERDRVASLHAKQVASALELERVDHALRVAEIELHDAHAEVAARNAAVAQAHEMLRQAERDLANAIVRAPIDGVVIERGGEVGRAVAEVTQSGGTVIAVIADDRRIRLVAEVDENDIASVRVGQRADASVDAFPGEVFPATVRKISSAGIVDGSVSSFEIELALEPDERLRVGMSSDAKVVVYEHSDVLLVPNTAIVRDADSPAVRMPDVAGGAGQKLVPVETGYSDGFETVIRAGLREGDVILVRREDA